MKMRSVINDADKDGVAAIADQQFGYAARISAAGLVPILEPEVSIDSPRKDERRCCSGTQGLPGLLGRVGGGVHRNPRHVSSSSLLVRPAAGLLAAAGTSSPVDATGCGRHTVRDSHLDDSLWPRVIS